MKQIFSPLLFLTSILLLIVSACNVNVDKSKLPATQLRIIDSIKHYYPIRHKKELHIPYHIENTGANPLAIYNIESSGPCITIEDYPKGPVQAGKEGTINILFKSDGLFGYNKHYITFETNTPPNIKHMLIFDVLVVADEFGYGDGFDYRYENLYESKNALETAVDGDETQNGYYTDNPSDSLKNGLK